MATYASDREEDNFYVMNKALAEDTNAWQLI
jgi:hypothetical protein